MSSSSSPYSRRQAAQRQALLEHRARAMRAFPSPPEARLWSALCAGRLGVRFRRQVVIGAAGAIVDFLAPSRALVVEVDGDAYHASRVHADAQRLLRLQRAGFRVVRIPASLVMADLPAAVALVREALG